MAKTNELDWTKPIQARDGREARFLCELGGEPNYPMVVVITRQDGTQYINHYKRDGRVFLSQYASRIWDTNSEIINVPERTSTFRLKLRSGIIQQLQWSEKKDAVRYATESVDCILELISENGRTVAAKVHSLEAE